MQKSMGKRLGENLSVYDVQIRDDLFNIQDMKEALLGNEFNKEGLVYKVENNVKQIEELVKFKQKIVAWATGAGLGSGTLVNLLMDLIK